MNRQRRTGTLRRAVLGWIAAIFALTLVLALAGALYADIQAGMPEAWRILTLLDSAVRGDGLAEVQGELAAARREDPRILGLLVIDPQGRTAAADPPEMVGLTFDLEEVGWGRTWERPVVDIYQGGAPEFLYQALGLDVDRWRRSLLHGTVVTLMRDVFASLDPNQPGGSHVDPPMAFIVALVDQSGPWGMTWHEVNRLLSGPVAVVGFMLFTLALAAWVWTDARERDMDYPPAWGILTLVTSVIGWATYLVIRTWQRPSCSNCGGALRHGYRACPHCGSQVGRACPGCGQPVRNHWSFCPQCSTGLN